MLCSSHYPLSLSPPFSNVASSGASLCTSRRQAKKANCPPPWSKASSSRGTRGGVCFHCIPARRCCREEPAGCWYDTKTKEEDEETCECRYACEVWRSGSIFPRLLLCQKAGRAWVRGYKPEHEGEESLVSFLTRVSVPEQKDGVSYIIQPTMHSTLGVYNIMPPMARYI